MNPTTRRYPHSLQEAFGPYTSNEISDEDELTWADYLGIALGLVSAGLLFGALRREIRIRKARKA